MTITENPVPTRPATTERDAARARKAVEKAERRAERDRMPAGHRPVLPRLGGLALVAGALLISGGGLTSPPQDSDSAADYITSLARDHGQTALSAGLFHYGWIAIAFGVLAAVTLVPGRLGRVVTGIGAVASAFGAMQFSGLLLNDWFLSGLGRHLPLDQAVTIFDDTSVDPWVGTWLLSAKAFGLLGLPVLMIGLARAGVVGWWTAPVMLLPMVGAGMAGAMAGPVVGALVGLLCWSPLFLVAQRLLRRPAAPVTAAA